MILEAHMGINNHPNQEQEVLRYTLARSIEKQFI